MAPRILAPGEVTITVTVEGLPKVGKSLLIKAFKAAALKVPITGAIRFVEIASKKKG